jgi:phosphate starvation-inducible PhoH-like protein
MSVFFLSRLSVGFIRNHRSISKRISIESSHTKRFLGKKKEGVEVPETPSLIPKTANQKSYVDYMNHPNVSIIVGVGPSGSGKTLLACGSAIEALKRGAIQKIILTRPLVSVDDEDLGFLPGTLMSKMDVWTRPVVDILKEFYRPVEIDKMFMQGVIEVAPLAYMRGRTFKNAFIIADEMQNSSPNQMLMVATRLGENTKLVITGDLKQSDRGEDNGLEDLMKKIRGNDLREPGGEISPIQMVELENMDIQRSPIVSKVLELYTGNLRFPRTPPPLTNIPAVNTDYSIELGSADCALIPLNRLPKNKEP